MKNGLTSLCYLFTLCINIIYFTFCISVIGNIKLQIIGIGIGNKKIYIGRSLAIMSVFYHIWV